MQHDVHCVIPMPAACFRGTVRRAHVGAGMVEIDSGRADCAASSHGGTSARNVRRTSGRGMLLWDQAYCMRFMVPMLVGCLLTLTVVTLTGQPCVSFGIMQASQLSFQKTAATVSAHHGPVHTSHTANGLGDVDSQSNGSMSGDTDGDSHGQQSANGVLRLACICMAMLLEQHLLAVHGCFIHGNRMCAARGR